MGRRVNPTDCFDMKESVFEHPRIDSKYEAADCAVFECRTSKLRQSKEGLETRTFVITTPFQVDKGS